MNRLRSETRKNWPQMSIDVSPKYRNGTKHFDRSIWTNSVDLDQTDLLEQFDRGLQCFAIR